MIAKLANQIANYWVKSNVITQEKKDIYVYGLDITIANIWTTILLLALSLLFGNVFYLLCYYACFLPLRGYCGGYHAKTHWGCALTQCILFTAVVQIPLRFLEILPYPLIGVLFAGMFVLVAKYAPIDHPANPLDDDKKATNKRNGLISLATILCVAITLMAFELHIYATIMTFSSVAALLSMLFARVGVDEDAFS